MPSEYPRTLRAGLCHQTHQPVLIRLQKWEAFGKSGKVVDRRNIAEAHILGQVGRVHVHLPLHLPCALGTMGLAAPACSFVFDVL